MFSRTDRSRVGAGTSRAVRRSAVLLVTGLLAVACGSSAAQVSAPSGAAPVGYAPWPAAEGDATHSAQAAVTGPQRGTVKWMAHLGPTTEGPSIGADGTIYEASDAGVLHAINPGTGRDLWTFDGHGPIGGDLSTTAAVLPDKTIVWPGSHDTVFGLSPQGRLLWTVKLAGVPLSPAVQSSTDLYVMTESGSLNAIRVTGGKAALRWKLPLGKSSFGSPVIRRDGVIETTVDNSLVAVKDKGGKAAVVWRFTVSKQVEVSPAVSSDGTSVLGTDDGFEYGVSASGKQVWKHAINTFSYSSPAVTQAGTTYYGDNRGVLTVANAATGAVTRTFDADPGSAKPGNIWTAPAIDATGDVYYGTNDGHVYGWSATGTRLFTVTTGRTVSSYPALSAQGDLLIGSADGNLYDIAG